MDLEPQPTDPFDVDYIRKGELPQNQMEASGEAESEVNSTGQPDEPIDTDPAVAVLSKEEAGSVYFDVEIEVILCDPPPVKVAMAPSDSSSRSLVRVDLAENFHHDDLDGALVLGSIIELAIPSAIVGLELEYMESVARSLVLELLEIDSEPQSPMVCKLLAIIEPFGQKVMVLGYLGEKIQRGGKRSKWVNQQYREICKLKGFPIDSHEQ